MPLVFLGSFLGVSIGTLMGELLQAIAYAFVTTWAIYKNY